MFCDSNWKRNRHLTMSAELRRRSSRLQCEGRPFFFFSSFFFSYLRPWVLVRPRESTISRPPALQSQTSGLPTELILPRWKVRLKYVNCPANVVYFPSANRFRNLKFVRVWGEFWWRSSQSLFFALVSLLAGYFPLRPCERPLKPFEQSKFCSSACLLHAEVHFMYFITTKYLVYRIRSHSTKVSTSV